MLRQMCDDFLAILSVAQDERKHRTDWVAYEQNVMLDLVNEERVKRGLSLVTLADVQRVEQFAVGHCDYSHKFSLYCAELALGIDRETY
jgi:hypothetical protein